VLVAGGAMRLPKNAVRASRYAGRSSARRKNVSIDTTSFAVLGRVMVGQRPRSIAVTRDGATVFVTDENSASISVLNAARRTLADTIRLPKADAAPTPPRPMGVVLSPDGTRLFVSNGRAGSVSVIDVATRRLVRTLNDVGQRPWGIGINRAGTTAFVEVYTNVEGSNLRGPMSGVRRMGVYEDFRKPGIGGLAALQRLRA